MCVSVCVRGRNLQLRRFQQVILKNGDGGGRWSKGIPAGRAGSEVTWETVRLLCKEKG